VQCFRSEVGPAAVPTMCCIGKLPWQPIESSGVGGGGGGVGEDEGLCTILAGRICSAPILRQLARIIACGDVSSVFHQHKLVV
jgi:hypothetical protein